MLTEHADLEVSTFENEDEGLLSKLSSFKPQVVVLDSADGLLASRIRLEDLFDGKSSRTVIALNVTQDDIRAFKHKRIQGATTADLLTIISGTGHRRRQLGNTEVAP